MYHFALEYVHAKLDIRGFTFDTFTLFSYVFSVHRPTKFTQLMYMGMPLFDIDYLDEVAGKRNARKVSTSEIADLLMQHHIIGVARGRSEVSEHAQSDGVKISAISRVMARFCCCVLSMHNLGYWTLYQSHLVYVHVCIPYRTFQNWPRNKVLLLRIALFC